MKAPARDTVRRLVPRLAAFSALLFILLPHAGLPSAKKPPKKAEDPAAKAEERPFKAPPGIARTVEVLSNFDEALVRPVLGFIDEETGLSCRYVGFDSGTGFAGRGYDLFLGARPSRLPGGVQPYESAQWGGFDPSLREGGLYTWSFWHSCLALNSLLETDRARVEANALGSLFGKLTAVSPDRDLPTLATLTALTSAYGAGFLAEVAAAIPVYRSSRGELVFAVESGEYAGAIGVQGYFRPSILKGYPIEILSGSLDRGRFPATTVRGSDVAFIPSSSRNREGAEYIVDFLARDRFQDFLADSGTMFDPVDPKALERKGWKAGYPPPESLIEWTYESKLLEDTRKAWEAAAFPAGTREVLR